MNINKLPVRELRQRMFVKQSEVLYGKTEYNYEDDIPSQIEALEGFEGWESFSKDWDVLWVGLDPRNLIWVTGRHHSPVRQLVLPLRIVKLDERSKRMTVTAEDNKDIKDMSVPYKEPIEESEQDRIISEALSGKVVIDEPDEEKAKRRIQETITELSQRLDELKDLANLK